MEKKKTLEKKEGILREFLFREITTETQRMKTCLAAVFVIGLIAHGYGFLNFTINHDSLREFYLSITIPIKISAGRFMQFLLRSFMGEVMTLPWLTGLTGLLFIGLAVYTMSKMFSLNTAWENILLGGICVANVTVTALVASYIHDFCGDMLAFLLSVCAAYLWHKMKSGFSWKATLLGAVCLYVTLGIYQSYLGVTITLMCLDSIMDLLKGESAKTVIKRLLWAAPMGILAASTYAVCLYRIPRMTGVVMRSDVRNLSNFWRDPLKFLEMLAREYGLVLQDLFVPNYKESMQGVFDPMAKSICIVNGLFLLLSGGVVGAALWKNAARAGEILLTLLLIGVLPLCMLCVNVFSAVDHNLTRFSVNLFYLMAMLMYRQAGVLRGERPCRWRTPLLIGLVALIIFSNVQMSNVAYIRKDVERQATLSTMTRVLTRLEQYEDYEYMESEVAIIGDVDGNDLALESGAVDRIVGVSYRSQITNRNVMKRYFEAVLQYPIQLSSVEKIEKIMETEEFRNMGIFPAKDAIATIDGVVVVKMSE